MSQTDIEVEPFDQFVPDSKEINVSARRSPVTITARLSRGQ